MKHWCNLKRTKYHYYNDWADPYIEYEGKMLNEWDVQEYLGNAFNDTMKELNIDIGSNEWHEKFAKWVTENEDYAYALLDDLVWALNGCP